MSQITEAQLKEVFDAIDTSGDGQIDKKELVNLLKQLGVEEERRAEIAKQMIEEGDTSGDGKISFAELQAAVCQ